MVQRHRAHDVRPTSERNDADSIVRPPFDKFACDFADRIHSCRFLSANREVFRQHRPGDIKYEHDVDPTRLDLSKTLAELRARKPNDENRKRSEQ